MKTCLFVLCIIVVMTFTIMRSMRNKGDWRR
jgi:hypothetical protein